MKQQTANSQQQILLIALSVLLIAPSCSIKKRIYLSGYHIEWHTKKHQSETKTVNHTPKKIQESVSTDGIINQEVVESPVTNASNELLATGDVSKIILVAPKSKFSAAIYDGKNISAQNYNSSRKEIKVAFKKAETLKKSADTKRDGGGNMIITLVLWFFLGFLAAHRWYAGKPAGWNILFILTLGGFGIWWIVDFFLILMGNFK